MPGLSWEIVRPNAVHLVGLDLDGNEVSIEATELEGRVFQHELDHLEGILLVERLNEDQRKERSRSSGAARWTSPRRIPTGSRDLFIAEPRPLPYGERVARLAYLGTPDMAVTPSRAGRGWARHRPLRDPAGPPARPWRPDHPQPGEGGGRRSRHRRDARHGSGDGAQAGVPLPRLNNRHFEVLRFAP